MTHIKRMVMHGFKSFARKTDIPFEDAMNVIVGPNGSGKSNVTDALCFVLGRLSIKSIRAAKAANLLFSGNKLYKGAREAYVELVFDNSDKVFATDTREVSIKRVVRKNGQSTYKINDKVKTRQELLELLSQAGIDPNGYNIVLQGEIGSLVKATPDERRKIIEEVAGISIYELRKHKSLRELERTEEKLKEVSAVLRERRAYLKNLEKERQEALSYQKLEETIKRCKATILVKSVKDKEKEILDVEGVVGDHRKEIEKIKGKINEKNLEISKLEKKMETVNKQIESSTSNEQEKLHKEISDLKADLAGLGVRRENFDGRILNNQDKIIDFKEKRTLLEEEISKIRGKSPEVKKQQEQQKGLQDKLNVLEEQRRRFYLLKSEISTLEHQKEERERFIIESRKEVDLIEKSIETLFEEIKHVDSLKDLEKLKKEALKQVSDLNEKIRQLETQVLESEKSNAVYSSEIEREEKMKGDISRLKFCFICKQEVTENHKHKIVEESTDKIKGAKKKLEEALSTRKKNLSEILILKQKLSEANEKLNEIEIDEIKITNSEEKKIQLKKLSNLQAEAKEELAKFNEKLHKLKANFEKLKNVEEDYDDARLKVQELSFADLDVDTEIGVKQREVNRYSVEIKNAQIDIEESEVELRKITALINEKDKILGRKILEEQDLYEKAQKFFEEKTELADLQKAVETEVIGLQHTIKNIEEKINHNKILKAQYNAQLDALKTELAEFGQFEEIKAPVDQIKERLAKSQFRFSRLGSVNMRALEVFEKVEEQCRLIQEKVDTIEGEKGKIEKIIVEIDKKKKKSFMTTLTSVNEYFTRNFSQLSRKGSVFLELENKKDPFPGGLNILIKVSRGRYFDITSLSGGEKTLVALSLIFAIQEYKPYCFYVFDEIDAALDKHNSELLAALIKKYMTTGQYIIITHNDTLISEATNLYGVSMQENISKIISLKV